MNKQNLIIYDFDELFSILSEIKKDLNFNLIKVSEREFSDMNLQINSYLILSKKEILNVQNQVIFKNLPLKISKIIETININFLKIKFNQQSDINLGNYKLNLNSRKIFNKSKSLNLTEREANIVIFLNNSKKPVKISKLQTEVWGHNSKLETHTVETHIYRLRKKINNIFEDKNFIKSSKSGYII